GAGGAGREGAPRGPGAPSSEERPLEIGPPAGSDLDTSRGATGRRARDVQRRTTRDLEVTRGRESDCPARREASPIGKLDRRAPKVEVGVGAETKSSSGRGRREAACAEDDRRVEAQARGADGETGPDPRGIRSGRGKRPGGEDCLAGHRERIAGSGFGGQAAHRQIQASVEIEAAGPLSA